MAYSVKYRVKVATQSNTIMKLDLLEDGYSGSVIEYPATTFNLQYIPASDDPFEPIIASQLSIGIDVTDNMANLPDFVTLNDRKYLCKLYEDSNIVWVGWALTENIQMPFTTGLKEIQFNAICGLGMLAYITYNTTATNTIFKHALLEIILNCLNSVNFDTNLNLFTACSMYSTTHTDRLDAPANEPFAQTYISLNSLQVSGKFKDCLTILKEILISFGCRLIQSNGEWNILQVNQQANATNYFTKFNNAGTVIGSGTYTNRKNIPANGHFIGNSQLKILNKGYNNIVSNNKLDYNDNLLYNGDFLVKVPIVPHDPRYEIPEGWTTQFTTNGINWAAMTNIYTGQYDTVALVGGPGTASLKYNSSVFVNEYEEIVLSLMPYSSDPIAIDGVNFKVKIYINTVSGIYSYNNVGTEEWIGPVLIPSPTSYYNVDNTPTNKQWTLNLKPAPARGMITIEFLLIAGSADVIGLSKINLKVNNQIEAINISSKITAATAYNKEVQLFYGLSPKVNGRYGFNGFISDALGDPLNDWYMMERPSDKYFSLAELTIKNYANLFFKNIVNVDATIEIPNLVGNTTFEFEDTDPAQISADNKVYLIGNSTYQHNIQELQGLCVEVSNTNQTATVTQEDVYPELTIPPFYARKIYNAPVNTDVEACTIGSVFNKTLYAKYISLYVGEYLYEDTRFLIPFDGQQKFWAVQFEERFTKKAIKIDTDGRIMIITNC
jgi:hypothetical protein